VFLSMDESGEKIERIVEFLDSKAAEYGRMLMQGRGTTWSERKS
jgi:hypothetical protein